MLPVIVLGLLVTDVEGDATDHESEAYNDDLVSSAWRNRYATSPGERRRKPLESQGNPSFEVSVCDAVLLSMQMLLPNSPPTVFAATHRGTDYGSEGRGFKSSWAYQSPQRVGGRLQTRRGQFPATAAVLRIRGLASTGAGRKSSPWIAASRTSMSDPLVTKAEIPAALMVRITSASSNEE